MHRIILCALLLAACAPKPPATSSFRAPEAPIWSAAAFQPAEIVGTWQQVASFQEVAGQTGEGCQAGQVAIQPLAGGLSISGTLCLNGKSEAVEGALTASGPGRLSVKDQEDWWVLWVDSGYRTLAVGTPSGRFGFILDRGAIPADRLAAAREVFDFNGYTTTGLQSF